MVPLEVLCTGLTITHRTPYSEHFRLLPGARVGSSEQLPRSNMAAETEDESTRLDRLRRVLADEVEDAAEGA